MSTGAFVKLPKENSEVINKHKTMATTTSSDRRTLKTLQLAADGTLTGSEKKPAKKLIQSKISLSSKPVKVYEDKKNTWRDTSSQTPRCELVPGSTQTDISGAAGVVGAASFDQHNDSGVGSADIDQEAYDLMVKDSIPESYWRDLAEERRLSLAEALSENEMLHQSMEEIKEENQNLSLLAGQAEYLASVLNDVLGDDNNKEDAEDEQKSDEQSVMAESTDQVPEETTQTSIKTETEDLEENES